jgi:hypothetical protein
LLPSVMLHRLKTIAAVGRCAIDVFHRQDKTRAQ